MIYTEEDIQKAYAIGYNEAVDDVNEYIDQESMEYNLDDEMDNYNEDYSARYDYEWRYWAWLPEWMKRHDLSNMRRHTEKKYGLSNDEVYHRNNFTDDQIRTFKKSYENSKWAKEGARRAAE